MTTVLTTTELAERWKVNREYIINMVEQGYLSCFNNTGSGSHKRFSVAYIEQIEAQGGIEPSMYDVLTIKRLEREIESKNKEISNLKQMIDEFTSKALIMKQQIG